ncbi:Mor transcription activator family protein [Methylocaldum szegediense]|uniref:Mor transcription activator family protein n=1 Tax=Methylocaldum szegediense TaxID=73780 RepID=UPI001F38B0C4|nr:Mor transcription activator family protein [Methylocaldum szegediense]
MLPDSLKALREHLSLKQILRLVEEFGGSKVYIPDADSSNIEQSALAQALGLEIAQALATSDYRGGYFWVPKADGLARAVRNIEIARLRKEGASIASLSRLFRLTDRQVYGVLKAAKHQEAANADRAPPSSGRYA